jgi:hypothetical protein
MEFRYSDIEHQLVQALPELRSAAESYWTIEGAPGQDSGAYIFFEQLFAPYVEVLLWRPASARRDELLHRAFAVVEQMLASGDRDVHDLAISLYEGVDPGWLKRARAFVGPRGREWLRQYDPAWPECHLADVDIVPEIRDFYHVRAVVANELHCSIDDVPGTTYTTGGLREAPKASD